MSNGEIQTPLGDAPLIPLLIMGFGAYLAWFGVHYWRDQSTIWPSDPLKDVLQGKGLPQPNPAASVESTAQATAASQGTTAGSLATGDDLSSDMQGYVGKVPYVWGGADPATGWDCSGAVNYAACHDLRLDIPGVKGGSFTGKTHGPDTLSWIAWDGCTTISRSDVQAGDLVVWQTHMGVAISNTEMVSAEDPKDGTAKAEIDAMTKDLGEVLVPRRIKQTVAAASSPGASGKGSPDVQQNQNTAKLLATPLGWGSGQQWTDLVSLWEKESGWNQFAKNAGSGAYGIPQALPATKLPKAGQESGGSDPKSQITWGLTYIGSRYGSPSAAWAHEVANGWY